MTTTHDLFVRYFREVSNPILDELHKKSVKNFMATGKHLPKTALQKAALAFDDQHSDETKAFRDAVLAGDIDAAGFRLSGEVCLRSRVGTICSYPGTAVGLKNGKFYVKYDHLEKPRMVKVFHFTDNYPEASPKLVKLFDKMMALVPKK